VATGAQISPGVFTRELDQSFLSTGIGAIGAVIIGPTERGKAFFPQPVTNANDFNVLFGENTDKTYVPYTVKNYLKNAGIVHVVRVLGIEGWRNGSTRTEGQNDFIKLYISSGSSYLKCVAVLAPTSGSDAFTNDVFVTGSVTGSGAAIGTSFIISGSGTTVSASFDFASPNYIEKVFGKGPESTSGNALSSNLYIYSLFRNFANSASLADTVSCSVSSSTGNLTFDNSASYSAAFTPWIQSQRSVSGGPFNLFRFATLSDGTNANTSYKISIDSVKKPASGSSDYGTFNVVIRDYADKDTRQIAYETFTNVDLNPSSDNYILKVIGDKYDVIDSNGRIDSFGDYPNKSKYVRIIPANGLENISNQVVPFGNSAYIDFIDNVVGLVSIPTKSYQGDEDTYNNLHYWGVDFEDSDAKEFFKPIPDSSVTNSVATMNLDDKVGHRSSSLYSASLSGSTAPTEMLKFTVGFQFGWDGMAPNRGKQVGAAIQASNIFGFDCSGASTSGSLAYKRALNTISDPDLFDVNMIITPGILENTHPKITEHVRNICDSRQDCFYVMDCVGYNGSITDAVNSVSGIDNNFTATYYPWIQIKDTERNKNVWVPPSVVIAEVISFTDKVASPWFAPAGLNRGGIGAVDVKKKVLHTERDTLYDGRVNPIATFPGQGISVWGQKTLQKAASALDRVNVRRLLIALKKFLASTSRYLLFEPNTNTTRQQFLNIANPYMDSVQRKSGVYAYRIVMDETNNTADVIDRNILKGDIYIQPTKAAEFIQLSFNIQPTGASIGETVV